MKDKNRFRREIYSLLDDLDLSNYLKERISRSFLNIISWVILIALTGIAFTSILWAVSKKNWDWTDAALNFGTEMAGAVVTFWLIGIVLGKRQKKEDLIAQMRSRLREIAIPAAEEISRNNWHKDGSLKAVNLSGANLERAELGEAYLERAYLYEVNLSGAFLGSANLRNAELSNANLEGINMFFANLQGAFLAGINLKDADLHGTNFESANLQQSNLHKADLSGTNLYRAEFYMASMQQATLFEANLRDASLRDTDLSYADFHGADLHGANLEGATYNFKTIWPDGFDPEAAGAILIEDKEDKPSD